MCNVDPPYSRGARRIGVDRRAGGPNVLQSGRQIVFAVVGAVTVAVNNATDPARFAASRRCDTPAGTSVPAVGVTGIFVTMIATRGCRLHQG